MHDDTTYKPNDSATICRIAPPADDRFDEEAFLRREMAEAKAAFGKTLGLIKQHAGRDLAPKRLVRRHPLALAGAVGVSGLLIARRIFRLKSGRGRRDRRRAEAAAPAKTGLVAMLVPSLVAVIQSLSAAKMSGDASRPASPQAWMVNQLWGMARDRFGNRKPTMAAKPSGPENGLKAVGSRTSAPEPMRQRRVRPR